MARDEYAPLTQRSPAPVPQDADDLPIFLQGELNRIWGAIQSIAQGHLSVVHEEPDKPREGDLRFADGTDWDPGAGKGVYIYMSGSWQKVV